MSRPYLRPTQPPTQWAPQALPAGVKRLVHEVDPLPRSSAEFKNVCDYIATPLCMPSWLAQGHLYLCKFKNKLCETMLVAMCHEFSSPPHVAALSKKGKYLPGCSPPSISILRYSSPIINSHLSYVILCIIFPCSLGSPLTSLLV
jgi:hypothetical protein